MRRLTAAPLPEWGDLFAALLQPPVSDDLLAVPWVRTGEAGLWFSRSAWSLAAVARWRQRMSPTEFVTVWIPDYFCNAALVPLRELGARLVFYPVTERMSPDVEAWADQSNAHIPDIVLLVHYFGQPTVAAPISDFCKKHGAWLVEDATHVLRPIPGVGEQGDCVLYSPHKHLPIPDGAVLVVRPDGPAQLKALSVLKEIRSAMVDSPRSAPLAVSFWLVKRLLQRLGLRSRKSRVAFRTGAEPIFPGIPHPEMSSLARRLLIRLGRTLDKVANLRERHSQDWRNVIQWANLPPSSASLSGNATPYLAGFSFRDQTEAQLSFDRLQLAGLPVVSWPDLPPEVTTRADLHCAAMALRHSCVYLPVHQTLDQRQILACGESLLDLATAKWQVEVLGFEQWEGYWHRCSKTNLPQSWQYGAAKEEAEGWKAHRFLITNEVGQPIGLVQVLTRTLALLVSIARINRGPLLLGDVSQDVEVSVKLAVLRVLLREARNKQWLMVQVAPEMPSTDEATIGLQSLGFERMSAPTWGSGRLGLEGDEQSLVMRLNGKWRNCMRKGEKLGVTVTDHEGKGTELELLLRSYLQIQSDRDFEGISDKLLRALAKQDQKEGTWDFRVFIARESSSAPNENPLGLLVTIRAGNTTTYLIGTSSSKGRQMQVNSVLLWRAVLHSKQHKCHWFDIGGLNKATPKGIAEFKKGLNAIPYELAGEWRKWLLIRGIKAKKI